MAHIHELLGLGVASPLARVLGSNRQMAVAAGGSSQEDATALIVNFAVLTTSGPGQGARLGLATGAWITALYNSGPDALNLYPAEDEILNDQGPNLPLALAAGQTALAVPSVDRWIVSAVARNDISDAPADGGYYGRYNGTWAPVGPLASPSFTGAPTAPTPPNSARTGTWPRLTPASGAGASRTA